MNRKDELPTFNIERSMMNERHKRKDWIPDRVRNDRLKHKCLTVIPAKAHWRQAKIY
jgi:hypothetical protein